MSTSTSIIQAHQLNRIFRDFWHRPKVTAVREASFEVRQGEIFGLLGPNGSGKSTTLKMILGLLHPSSGSLQVLGKSPRDVKTKARLGYLPEDSYLYPYLTAEETLDFYARLFDLKRAERVQRIQQLLEMVGLAHAADRQVREFSKGMARRIGLAQALINDPELVILDEPTSGLDPIGCRQVKDLILALAKRGKTVLLTSHLLADVEDLCDRVAIMYNGRIEAMGSIKELLELKDRVRLKLPDGLGAEDGLRAARAVQETLGIPVELEHPRRDLESFFLDVVDRARSSVVDQTGADSNRSIARYLSDKP